MANHSGPIIVCIWTFYCLAIQATSDPMNIHQTTLSDPSSGSSGCGVSLPSLPGQSQNFTFFSEHGGGQRDYLIHLPQTYELNHPHPLIFSFHGFTQTKHHQELISKFSNSTINQHAITVYPQGLGSPPAWQGAPYSAKGVDDLAFTKDLVAYIKGRYCVDPQRVFATGMSNGGGFVNTLACSSEGAEFTAFAAVAGAFYEDVEGGEFECEPARLPNPIMEIHGDEDGIIPYGGGEASGVPIPAIPDWLHTWAVRNGCSGSSVGKVRKLVDGNVRETSFSCNGSSHQVVVGVKVSGMAHVWPSTTPNLENGNITTWIDAAPYILEFFERYRKAFISR